MERGSRTERRKKEKEKDVRDRGQDSLSTRSSRADKEGHSKGETESVLGSSLGRKRTSASSASSILTTSSTSTVRPSKPQARTASLSLKGSASQPGSSTSSTSIPKSPPGRSVPAAGLQPTQPTPARDVAMADNSPTHHTLGSTSSISRSNTVPSSFESRRSKRSNSRPSDISPRAVRDLNTNVQGQYPARKGVYRERRDWDSESNGEEELTPRPRRFPVRPEYDQRSFSEQPFYPPPGYAGPPPLPHRAFSYDQYFNNSGFPPITQGPPRRRRSRSGDSNHSQSSSYSEDSDVFQFLDTSEETPQPSAMGLNSRTTSKSTTSSKDKNPDRIVVKKRTSHTSTASISTTNSNSSDEASVASTLVDTPSGSNSPINGVPSQHRLFSPTGKPIRVLPSRSFSGPLSARRPLPRPADSYRRFSGLTRVHLDSLEKELRDLERQIAKLEEAEDLDDEDDEEGNTTRAEKKRQLIAFAGARLMIYHQAIAAYKGLPDFPEGGDFVDIRPEPKPEGFKGVIPYISSTVNEVWDGVWDFGVKKWHSLDNRTRFYGVASLGLILAVMFRARFWFFVICFLTMVIWMNSGSKEAAKKTEKEKLTEATEESADCVVKKEKKEVAFEPLPGSFEIPGSFDLPGSFEGFGMPTEFGIDVPIGGLLSKMISVGA